MAPVDAPAGEDAVKATEPVTLTPEQFKEFQEAKASLGKFKELQAQVTLLTNEKRKAVTEATFSELKFNETTQTGTILPKDYDACVAFALSLSEKKSEEFFNIIKGIKSSVQFSENGEVAKESTKFSTAAVNEETQRIMKDEKLSFSDAQKKALAKFELEDQE